MYTLYFYITDCAVGRDTFPRHWIKLTIFILIDLIRRVEIPLEALGAQIPCSSWNGCGNCCASASCGRSLWSFCQRLPQQLTLCVMASTSLWVRNCDFWLQAVGRKKRKEEADVELCYVLGAGFETACCLKRKPRLPSITVLHVQWPFQPPLIFFYYIIITCLKSKLKHYGNVWCKLKASYFVISSHTYSSRIW